MATIESKNHRRGKLPYLTERRGFLGVVNVDGSFRRLGPARTPQMQEPSPEYIEKHIWQRWHELFKRLKG